MAVDERQLNEERAEEQNSEDEGMEAEKIHRRNDEYMRFRRDFDKLKQNHEGSQAESEKIKVQGNNFFKLGLYSQASMMYSEAIELQPENAVLYCNRAMAYIKQDMPHEALADAESSLGIDSTRENIKAYWRQAQALLDLDRAEESETAADNGLALYAGNKHLNQVRKAARESSTKKKLCGDPWVVTMPNGVEKRYTFESDGTLKIGVFGQWVPASYDLSVEGNPKSMFVKMKAEAIGAGNGPPPPPRPYIYEFHDDNQELWLCTPLDSNELPKSFEGPGFDRLRRVVAERDSDFSDAEPINLRCGKYIREMNEIMPLLPPQLPEEPTDSQISQQAVVMDKVSKLKRKFGMQVHQRALELSKDPELAESLELKQLAQGLQMRLVARKIIDLPAMKPKQQEEQPVTIPITAVSAPAPGQPARLKSIFASCVAGICGGVQ